MEPVRLEELQAVAQREYWLNRADSVGDVKKMVMEIEREMRMWMDLCWKGYFLWDIIEICGIRENRG